MLIRLTPRDLLGARGAPCDRQVWKLVEPRHARVNEILLPRLQLRRPVEAAEREIDLVAADRMEGKRRSASAAEATLRGFRAAVERRPAARPLEVRLARREEGDENRTERFLAHPAVADQRIDGLAMDGIADGAALAAAGER